MIDPTPVVRLPYAAPDELPPARWARLPLVALLCMSAAWTIGTGTNFINGHISLIYFQTLVGWMYGQMGIGDVVFQGLLESTVVGLIFTLIFGVTYAASTGARCPVRPVIRIVATAVGIAFALWIVGGVLGLLWATLSPSSFRAAIPIIPDDLTDLHGWGWVGGSIIGAYVGGVLTIFGSPIVLHFYWRRKHGKKLRFAARDL